MFAKGFDPYVCVGEVITCEVDGFTVTARIHADDDSTPPWDREDGHGPVSGWTSREATKGERVLNQDRGQFRYYDFDQAKRTALKEGWGGEGVKGNPNQRAVLAAELDFEFIRTWCKDDWSYVGVAVTVSRCDVELTDEYDHAVWGTEMNCPGFDSAHLTELANEIMPEALVAARSKLLELTGSVVPTP